MSYGDPFAGSAGHFNSVSSNPQYYSTQPCAQQYSSSSEGSPDLSDSSQNSLPRGYQDNRYAYTTQAFPASISPLPMGNYPGPYPFNLAIAQTSWHLAPQIGSLNEQGIPNPLIYMQTPAHGAYNQHAPHHDFGPAREPLLQAHHQTPRDEPDFGGNSDIIRSYYFQNGQGLGADTGGETSFNPQVSSDAQQSHPTGNSPDPNTRLGGSQNEAMGNVDTTYPSTIASPQSPLDANDEVASPQSMEMENPQTEGASGQQNTSDDQLIDSYLLPKFLPQAATGAGSRGGKESWTCTHPGCVHRPFIRQDQARDHVAAHLDVKRFWCQHCQKGFIRRYDCNRHAEKSCKSPQASSRSGLPSLAPAPGNSRGAISPISAGSSPQFLGIPSDGGAKKEDARGLQLIGPHRTLPRTKARSKSSPRLQVRSGSKRGRKGSKSPSSAGGSPTTHPDDMWLQH